jgi:hypothetical protein
MFSFVKSGAIVTAADLGTSFCACAPPQVIRTMVSTAEAIPVFFMVAFSLKCAHSAPSFIQTPPPLASFVFLLIVDY